MKVYYKDPRKPYGSLAPSELCWLSPTASRMETLWRSWSVTHDTEMQTSIPWWALAPATPRLRFSMAALFCQQEPCRILHPKPSLILLESHLSLFSANVNLSSGAGLFPHMAPCGRITESKKLCLEWLFPEGNVAWRTPTFSQCFQSSIFRTSK